MASNEHPDMSGNPCDDPIVCDQCGDPCNESDLYGSVYDEDKNFCRKQCVDDWEEGWEDDPTKNERPQWWPDHWDWPPRFGNQVIHHGTDLRVGAVVGGADVSLGEVLTPVPKASDTELYRKSDGSFAGLLLSASDCVTVNKMCQGERAPDLRVCYVSPFSAAFDVEVVK
jgi:hypothetical protein